MKQAFIDRLIKEDLSKEDHILLLAEILDELDN